MRAASPVVATLCRSTEPRPARANFMEGCFLCKNF